MRVMGLRAEKDCFRWIVLEGTSDVPVKVDMDRVRAPAAYGEAESLAFFRSRLLSLIEDLKPEKVVLKKAETFGRGKANVASTDARIRVEGVLLESAHASGVSSEAMQWRKITSGMDTDSAKDYAKQRGEVRGITLDTRSGEAYEALLVAIAALRC
jgi:hypothetical protein